jgi:hypothetical protein
MAKTNLTQLNCVECYTPVEMTEREADMWSGLPFKCDECVISMVDKAVLHCASARLDSGCRAVNEASRQLQT